VFLEFTEVVELHNYVDIRLFGDLAFPPFTVETKHWRHIDAWLLFIIPFRLAFPGHGATWLLTRTTSFSQLLLAIVLN
jgi:hypothetical protein